MTCQEGNVRFSMSPAKTIESQRKTAKRGTAAVSKRSRGFKPSLSLPDLVLLSLLAERPMHGYEANALLEQRQVRDWAGISRAQVYYSFDKLAAAGLLAVARDTSAPAGPEKQVLRTTAKGRAQLAAALARESWATHRERPPFLTWLALSWQAAPNV